MDESSPRDPAPPERPWQFSLRQLFGLFLVAGIFALIYRDAGLPDCR
ncbi:MAG: hypothetical protein KY475_01325 [Planctomycetes bacterium]|nr:hypothetical protein [Planctomycetota bacterium]